MNKYKLLFSDTLIFGVGNFTTKIIYFFLMPIYTLALTTEDFGLADLLNNSLQLVLPIFTLSITDAVFRFTLDDGCDYRLLLCNGLRVIGGSYIVLLFVIYVIYLFYPSDYWWLFLILYISESLKSLFAQFARGVGKIKSFALSGIISSVFLLGITYLFLQVFKLGISGYMMAFIIANIVSVIFLFWKVNIKLYIDFSLYDKSLLWSMIMYSLPLIPNMLSWWITNISSRYIVAGYSGLSIAGLFASASKIPALINVMASVFQLAWQSASVKEYQESTKSEFYSNVFCFYSFFVIISSSLILAILPYLSYFILKGKFYEAWVYTPLLLFSAILCCYSIFFGTFYAVVKDNKKAMYTTMTGAVFNILLCFLLIPTIGIVGALIANVASYVIIVILRIRDTRKYIYIMINYTVIVTDLFLVFCQAIILSISFEGHIFVSAIISIMLILIHRRDLFKMFYFVKMMKKN